MEMRPILLTGATGQVGSALLPRLRNLGPVVAPSRAEMNLADANSVRAVVRATRPRWIVNPGAYTAVDKAESERDAAWTVNAQAPGVLGEEARKLGIPVIHVSTDYVFSGAGSAQWRETDRTGPLNEYGRSKLAGEAALASSGAAHVTLRTSWVYAATGQNFLRTMLRLGRERDELRVVGDQHGTPTAAGDLADLIVFLLRHFEGAGNGTDQDVPAITGALPGQEAGAENAGAVAERVQRKGGLVHAAGSGEATTWFGFAEAIFAELAAKEPNTRVPRLKPIATLEYPTPAQRPMNSQLSCNRLETRFGYKMPEWRASLRAVMREVVATEPAAAGVAR